MKNLKFLFATVFVISSFFINSQQMNRECQEYMMVASDSKLKKNFQEAATYYWKIEKKCPLDDKIYSQLRYCYESLISEIKDEFKKKAFIDTLITVYELREKKFGKDPNWSLWHAYYKVSNRSTDYVKIDDLMSYGIKSLKEKAGSSFIMIYFHNLMMLHDEEADEKKKLIYAKRILDEYDELHRIVAKQQNSERGIEYIASIRQRILNSYQFQSTINKEVGKSVEDEKHSISSGSGILITTNGYIVTNYHVIEESIKIEVTLNNKTYGARVVKVDKTNDLALLKIEDPKYIDFSYIPFTIKGVLLPLGEKVFSLGYPMTQLQGINIKFTEGSISSKTGFQDDPVCYQISVPLQPGNSGGPLFDFNGNLVGIVNAGIMEANLVGYAIKNTYLLNFLDVVSELPAINSVNQLANKSFTQQAEELVKYCCLIKVWRSEP